MNPYGMTAGVSGLVVTITGLALLLVPHLNQYGLAGDIDLVRLWSGAAVTIAGFVLLAAWAIVAGVGWTLNRRQAPLSSVETPSA